MRRVLSMLSVALGRPVRHGSNCWTIEPDWGRHAYSMGTEGGRWLPSVPEYYLDESDPDVLVLRRQDGAFVAAFSAQGATREGILEAAEEEYAKSIEADAQSPGVGEDGYRKRSA